MPEENLIRRALFESPTYTDKFKKVNVHKGSLSTRSTAEFDTCKKDKLPDWLTRNAFHTRRSGFALSNKFRHHLFMGGNGTLCNLILYTFDRDRYTEEDRDYTQLLILETQPAKEDVPKEVEEVLDELKYCQVDPITEKFLKDHYMTQDYKLRNGILVPSNS
jgi:hypothetical protein|tara:strand:+ start:189 stop:674 length:486 start_codon:yes stop_codon:yes gene_type:complete